VAWLGGQGIKQARIRLHPEELGSLDVKVSVTHGRVDVVFSAQHPAAVAAVQQSLPQLDQMLAQHGLSLGHAEVGQQDRGDRHGHAGDAGAAPLDEPGEIHADTLVIAETPVAETALGAALTARGIAFHQIGDAVAPRRASLAFYEGRELARRL